LRYFNVYGPGQSEEYAGVIKNFIDRIKHGEPPVIYGDGLQTRDFVHVKDVANANLLALNSPTEFGVFNIASGESITILNLARMISDLMGSKFQPIFGPPRKGDIRHSKADIHKARKVLGFEPRIDLRSGIRMMLTEGVES